MDGLHFLFANFDFHTRQRQNISRLHLGMNDAGFSFRGGYHHLWRFALLLL
jgi:hypothetical protein